MKYAFIEMHRPIWRLRTMCRSLSVSTSGYFCWRFGRTSSKRSSDRALSVKIKAIHAESKETYGSPRVCEELASRGERVNRKRVERIMRLEGLNPKPHRRFVVTTDSDHALPIAPNLLEQDFTAVRPNQKWVSDITYIPTDEGFLFLAGTIDLFSRKVVGWALDERMDRGLVLKALDMAIRDRAPAAGVIHHSDRGSQYVSIRYTERLAEAGIEPSVGSVGDSYDNALAETINGLYKAEVIHRRGPWRSFEAVEYATLEWVDWFNNRRLLAPIGNIPPAEAEERYYAMLDDTPMAA